MSLKNTNLFQKYFLKELNMKNFKTSASKHSGLFIALLLFSKFSLATDAPVNAVGLPNAQTPTVPKIVVQPIQFKPQKPKTVDLTGSHTGYSLNSNGRDDQKIELLLRPVSGKRGSYWALLLVVEKASEPHAQLFRMDPFGLGKYGMYSVSVNEETQSLLINDGRPVMIFSVDGFGSAGRPLVSIYPNIQESSDSGARKTENVQTYRIHNNRSSKWTWTDLNPGFYSDSCFGPPQATVGPLIDGQDSSSSFSGYSGTSGGYILRRQFPGVYSVHHSELSEVNVHLKTRMDGLVYFLIKRNVFLDDHMMLFVGRNGEQTRSDRR